MGQWVEAMGLEPTNLLTASQALYQLSYAPREQRNDVSSHRVAPSRFSDQPSTSSASAN